MIRSKDKSQLLKAAQEQSQCPYRIGRYEEAASALRMLLLVNPMRLIDAWQAWAMPFSKLGRYKKEYQLMKCSR